MNELELLQDSLEEWISKWDLDIDKYRKELHRGLDADVTEEYCKMIVQRNSMKYVAQWIINSINGGLNKVHNTNICNIILKEESDYE